MKSYIIKIAGIAFGLIICLCLPTVVLAYDNEITHPGIADMAVELYNQKFDPDLTNEEKEWIKRGANEEDYPTRWFHHFYDPVYNHGYSDVGALNSLNIFGLSFSTAVSWLQDPADQMNFALGDRSWSRGLYDYGIDDREMAFVELGHAIHLISDMAVPAHTRDSEHVFDSYESFVKNNWENIRPTLYPTYMSVRDLNATFYKLANYTNHGFYSDKTIESEKYNIVGVDFVNVAKKGGDNYFLAKTSENIFLYHAMGFVWNITEKEINDPLVLSDYAKNLIPQAVGYSAGMIQYFIEEGEKQKKIEEEKNWLTKTVESTLAKIRINNYGLVNQAFGYMVNLGGIATDKYRSQYSDTAPEFVDDLDYQKLTMPVVVDPPPAEPEKPKIDSVKKTKIEEPINDLSEKQNLLKKIIQIEPDDPEPALEENKTNEENLFPEIINSPFTPFSGQSTPMEEEETITPNFPAPLLADVFSDIITTTSPQINIFGTTATDTSVVKAFYKSNFDDTDSLSEIEAPISLIGDIWSGVFDLINTTNTFRFLAISNTGVTSTLSNSAKIILAPTPEPWNYIYLDGEQEENERILTKDLGPYILQNYTVPIGKKLVIEPGVMIKAVEGGQLLINGELVAQGTADYKIIFTSIKDQVFDDEVLAGAVLASSSADIFRDWGGIDFMNDASGTLEYVQIKYSGMNDLNKYGTYGRECGYSQSVFLYLSTISLSHTEFISAGQTAVCGLQSDITVSDSVFDGFENTPDTGFWQSFSLPMGYDGVWISSGNLTINNSSFSNYSRFPVVIFNSPTDIQNIVYSGNLFNSPVTLLTDQSYGGIYQGDDFYIIARNGGVTKAVQLAELDFFQRKKIYIIGKNSITGSFNFIGTVEDPLEIIFVTEYSSSLYFENKTIQFTNIKFKMTEPNLLWLSLSGIDDQHPPSLYGWIPEQSYANYIANNLSIYNDPWRTVLISFYNANMVFNNCEFTFGPIPANYILTSVNSVLTLNNSQFIWNYIEENSWNNRSTMMMSGLFFIGGNDLSIQNTSFSYLTNGLRAEEMSGMSPDVDIILFDTSTVQFNNVDTPFSPPEFWAIEE